MYPSDKVWKGIDNSLRSRRKWYWSGFVLLLSGISYLAITHLLTPSNGSPVQKAPVQQQQQQQVTAEQLNPFTQPVITAPQPTSPADISDAITSDFSLNENGDVTAAFEIPLNLPGTYSNQKDQRAAVLISGLAPLKKHEQYNFEVSWPVEDINITAPGNIEPKSSVITLHPVEQAQKDEKVRINWLLDNAAFKLPELRTKRISWQLAFSPTVNYRKLTGSKTAKMYASAAGIPVATQIDGDIDNLVNHKPALGFELGTHGLLKLNKRFTAKAGLQFNYS